jgi:hypothetical protein
MNFPSNAPDDYTCPICLGNQHVFPRYEDDDFNENMIDASYLSEEEERVTYAERLREEIKNV